MGWLGWTEAATLDTSIPSILLAYEGRVEMLRKTFGAEESAVDPEKTEISVETAGQLLFARVREAAK